MEVVERARRFLSGELSPPRVVAEGTGEALEQDAHWATLGGLLRYLIRSEWPAVTKRAARRRTKM
jgi:hypothetical protein